MKTPEDRYDLDRFLTAQDGVMPAVDLFCKQHDLKVNICWFAKPIRFYTESWYFFKP